MREGRSIFLSGQMDRKEEICLYLIIAVLNQSSNLEQLPDLGIQEADVLVRCLTLDTALMIIKD